ncbi:interleukin-36 receptor antagonist protein-like [Apteryx mantelli]|uniref:Interleukin-1 n=1 Tax=Apteryx mantelli TaxID=2696672 RepID=A0ABM4FUN3_9AVES
MACRRCGGAAEHPFLVQGEGAARGGRPLSRSAAPAAPVLRYVKSRSFAVRDVAQKALAMHTAGGRRHLLALHLRGANARQEVTLRLDFYKPLGTGPAPGVPVALHVDGCGLLLSCGQEAAGPVLWLEEADGPVPEIGAKQRRFLFFRLCSGTTCRFESALSPGWFLATANRDRALLALAPAATPGAILDFHLYPSAAIPPPRPAAELAAAGWHGCA